MSFDELKSGIDNELTLYYQEKYYLWDDLIKKINHFSIASPYIVSAQDQDRFSTVLILLYGFINMKTVFLANSVASPFFRRGIEGVANKLNTPPLSNEETTALAIATSGSQSKAKIIFISRTNIVSHCDNFIKAIPINTSSVWLNCMPLNHIAGVMIIYRCWFNNASMLLHDNFNARKVWDDLHHFSVTHISLVPRMLSQLLEHSQNSEPPKTLKFAIVGGDKISESLFQRAISAGWPVYLSYGMTEATSTIAIGYTPDKLTPLSGFKIQLTSDNILKIKGAMVVQEMLAQETIVKEVPASEEWFETNDRVMWDGQYLSVQGRNDNMIISGGKNMYPQYIESLLSVSPVIDDIAIGKVSNDEWGDTIAALVCGDLDEFKIWVKKEIQSACQPRIFIKVEQIPRNVMGKIDRKEVVNIISNHN